MEKRLKVFFVSAYQEKVSRGAERFVLELSKRLKKDFDVKVISGKLAPSARWPVLWRFFIDPNGLKVLFFSLKILPTVVVNRPDVVVAINGGWQVVILRLITLLYGGKLVVSGQSGIGWDDRVNLWSFPNRFVGLTSYQTNWAKKINPFIDIMTIPNGVDLRVYKSAAKKTENLVIGVGALENWKRWDLLIKALGKLDSVKLKLIGRGKNEEEIKKLGSKVLGARFSSEAYAFDKMPEVYKRASILVYPTNEQESFGIVMVEAMASGLPVVATDDPIRREIVGKAGLFVDPTDIDLFAKKIKEALEKDWGEIPRIQAEKYDWDKIALKYEKLILKLCEK